jgi:hypothetical protein
MSTLGNSAPGIQTSGSRCAVRREPDVLQFLRLTEDANQVAVDKHHRSIK